MIRQNQHHRRASGIKVGTCGRVTRGDSLMKKSMRLIVWLVLLGSTVGGCTKTVRMDVTEARKKVPKNIVEVDLSSGLRIVTLESGDEVRFDSLGVRVDEVSRAISGTSPSGKPSTVKLNDVSQTMFDIEAVITFHEKLGFVDSVAQIVTEGDHQRQNIPLDDVLFLKVRKVDAVATTAAIIAGGFLIWAFSRFAYEPPDWSFPIDLNRVR